MKPAAKIATHLTCKAFSARLLYEMVVWVYEMGG